MAQSLYALNLPMGFLLFPIVLPFCFGGSLYTVSRVLSTIKHSMSKRRADRAPIELPSVRRNEKTRGLKYCRLGEPAGELWSAAHKATRGGIPRSLAYTSY